MTDRYTPISPSQLTADQKEAYDYATSIADKLFGPNGDKFIYKRASDGAFLGPFAPLLYTPHIVKPYFETVIALGQIKGFPASAKETAILATGSVFQSGYELYAHMHVAEKTGALTKHQINAISTGIKPVGEHKLDEACDVAFDVSIELARGLGSGKLSDQTYERARKEFGEQGMLALIHYVGIYAYTSIILNAVNASVPEK